MVVLSKNKIIGWLYFLNCSTGRGVKDRLVNSGDKYNHTCNMVFCGWDYGLSTPKAAKLKNKNLRNEFTVRTHTNTPSHV